MKNFLALFFFLVLFSSLALSQARVEILSNELIVSEEKTVAVDYALFNLTDNKTDLKIAVTFLENNEEIFFEELDFTILPQQKYLDSIELEDFNAELNNFFLIIEVFQDGKLVDGKSKEFSLVSGSPLRFLEIERTINPRAFKEQEVFEKQNYYFLLLAVFFAAALFYFTEHPFRNISFKLNLPRPGKPLKAEEKAGEAAEQEAEQEESEAVSGEPSEEALLKEIEEMKKLKMEFAKKESASKEKPATKAASIKKAKEKIKVKPKEKIIKAKKKPSGKRQRLNKFEEGQLGEFLEEIKKK